MVPIIADADALHIAAWHPAVALAVADWLDHEALFFEQSVNQGFRVPAKRRANALAVANAYLGTDHPARDPDPVTVASAIADTG